MNRKQLKPTTPKQKTSSGFTRKRTSKHGSLEEHDNLVGQIIWELERQNLAFVWEHKTGAAWREGVMIHYGLYGSADIIGVMRNGRFIAIEVKTGAAQQMSQQVKFMNRVHTMNGDYIVARDVSTVVEYVKSRSNL